MSHLYLVALATACLTAAVTPSVFATDSVSYGTSETCKFPFLYKNSWWNTCTSIGTDKPWCILKPEFKPPPPANDWLTCDNSLTNSITALVDGVQDDCVTRQVDGETVSGCSSNSEAGPFTCLTKSGKIGTCVGSDSKLKAGKQDANIKSAIPAVGDSSDAGDKKSSGASNASTIAGSIAAVGAVGLVAGLFVYRRRQSNRTLDWQNTEQKNDPGDMGISGLSTSNGNRDSTASSQMFSPVNPGERLYPVICTYTPTLGDELEIQPGDKISILIEYDDGWCQGINHTRGGLKGVFPKHCVDMSGATTSADSSVRLSAGPIDL